MKILHTIRQGEIGGGETHVLELIRNLPKEQFECAVLAFTPGEMVESLRKMGVSCRVIHTQRPFDVRVWGEVRQFIAEGNFDLVHAHGTRACSNTFWAARSLKLPLIYTVHGWSFRQAEPLLPRMLKQFCEKLLVNQATQNILVSQSNYAEGHAKLRMPASEVIYNGVDLEKFSPANSYSLRKEDLELPHDKLIITMIARLTFQKDPLTLIRAAGKVIASGVGAHFLIVGDGELRKHCERMVAELAIGAHVTFTGFRNDIAAILDLSDVYCLPSLWEGLPIGILEAMAMKKAVIATPVDGSAELITHETTGILVEKGQVQSWADAIVRLCNDQTLRNTLSNNAYKLVHDKFSVEQMAERTRRVYRRVMNEIAVP